MSRRVPELDGLRGIAILLVIVCHYLVMTVEAQKGSPLSIARGLLGLTWSGVDLFFVLSGFLIGGILVDSRDSPRYYRTFLARRIHRIFPVYYLSLLLFAAGLAAGLGSRQGWAWLFGDAFPLATYATFTQNFAMALEHRWGPYWTNITWSLAVEEQFYIVLPFVVWLVPNRLLPRVLIGGILIAPALRTLLWFTDPNVHYPAYALMPCRADALGLGALAAVVLRKPNIGEYLPTIKRWLYPAFFVLLAGMGALTVFRVSDTTLLMNSIGYTWIALFYLSILLIGVISPGTPVGAVLRNPALQQFGTLAYFIYMFHQAANGIVHIMLFGREPKIDSWASALATVMSLAALFLAAKLSWRYMEKPLIKRGHTYKY
jgi:peptidoglycan/LPS O-acetylase OafA/YrhL